MDPSELEDGFHEQLDLNAPLISTRHFCTSVDASGSYLPGRVPTAPPEPSRSVPFLWERSPGVSKDSEIADFRNCEEPPPPPPRPPPGRWRPSGEDSSSYGHRSSKDDSEGGDVWFSDAMDVMSLSDESLDIALACGSNRLSGIEGPGRPDAVVSGYNPPSSFIFDRFLPAARALANTTAVNFPCVNHHSNKGETRHPLGGGGGQQAVKSTWSPKTCGLVLFFPWSVKQTVCGFKAPGRSHSPTHRPNGSVCSDLGGGNGRQGWRGCGSPGWGVRFLDKSRLVERGRRQDGKRGEVSMGREICKPIEWNLPAITSPSESWLARVLNSTNKRG